MRDPNFLLSRALLIAAPIAGVTLASLSLSLIGVRTLGIIETTLLAMTPLVLAATGECLNERAGMVNVALEGIIVISALFSVYWAEVYHSGLMGLVGGVVTGMLAGLVLGVLGTYLKANQIVVGMGLNVAALGRVLRYGAYSPDVLARLRYLNGEFAEVIGAALRDAVKDKEGIDLRNIIAQALHMGDECHNRNVAATSLFLREIAPYVVREVGREGEQVLRTIDSNNHFFVNLAMAACKLMADAASDVKYSTIVTTISRNGTEVGIRVSGLGNEWFTAPAPVPRGLYFPGFSERDANPDIGDSTITETAGIGGAAMAASPAIVRFVGGTVMDAIEMTMRMEKITFAKHKHFTIPYLEFSGTPTGIDIRKVVQTGLTPVANTGIAHREPGVGQIGAGIVELPMEPFKAALRRFAEVYGIR
jgi:hypothetical protein